MLALHVWARREGINYAQARKLYMTGKIPGATEGRNVQNKPAVYVPEDTKLSRSSSIACLLCGKELSQITNTHLAKVHNITLNEYKKRYPDAALISDDVKNTLSEKSGSRTHTEATKLQISANRSGQDAWNKGLSGIIKDSPETIEKKRQAQLGRSHPQEVKQKIGDKSRGKIMPSDDVERRRLALIERYTTEVHPNAGRKFDEFHSAMMREVAIRREASYTAEQKSMSNMKRSVANTGLKRTNEQKQTYRAARVKWMSENPTKVINTAGERTIAEWLDQHRIHYVRQFVILDFFHPYDFFLPDHNTIIEFDGAHHWWRPWFKVLGKSLAERNEMMRLQMEKDAVENSIAGLSGYRIIRIRGVADCGDSPEYGSLEEQLAIQGFDMPE